MAVFRQKCKKRRFCRKTAIKWQKIKNLTLKSLDIIIFQVFSPKAWFGNEFFLILMIFQKSRLKVGISIENPIFSKLQIVITQRWIKFFSFYKKLLVPFIKHYNISQTQKIAQKYLGPPLSPKMSKEALDFISPFLYFRNIYIIL